MRLNNAECAPRLKLEREKAWHDWACCCNVFSQTCLSSSTDAVNGCLASSFLHPEFMIVTLSTLLEVEKA